MNWKSTLILLRIPFSFFLLPVYLFAFWYVLSQKEFIQISETIWSFLILHFMVYPASNGYNSLQDRDTDSIGGLKNPPQPTHYLRYLVGVLDMLALILGYWMVHPMFFIGLMGYILASRAYSYRGIRLKQYPYVGFAVVFFFQGMWLFLLCMPAFGLMQVDTYDVFIAVGASCLIGAMYPLTQIYQHRQDQEDGVTTISMRLGYTGTFFFSACLFIFGMGIIAIHCCHLGLMHHWLILQLGLSPSLVFFINWFKKVKDNPETADFENTMKMNLLSSSGLVGAFIVILVMLIS